MMWQSCIPYYYWRAKRAQYLGVSIEISDILFGYVSWEVIKRGTGNEQRNGNGKWEMGNEKCVAKIVH